MMTLPTVAAASPPPTEGPDALAGPRDEASLHPTLRSALQAVGVTPVEGDPVLVAGSDGPATVGGYVSLELALDFDGDGDEEVLLAQYAARDHFVAIGEDGIIWRRELPRRFHADGYLVGDLYPMPGDEVLVFAHRYARGDYTELVGLLGRHGLLWSTKLKGGSGRLLGLVEADGDPEQELAFEHYGEDGLRIRVMDGAGGSWRQSVGSSFEETTTLGASDVFVTDGTVSDEAVFITPLPADVGYHGERVSLSTGEVVASELITEQRDFYMLSQGADHTGDGRRDAVTTTWSESGESYGVFDPTTLRVVWTNPSGVPRDDDGIWGWEDPYPGGDVDGDGAIDLCHRSRTYTEDSGGESEEWTDSVRCESGKTGARLWKLERTGSEDSSEDTFTWGYFSVASDLDASGVLDPVFESQTYRCMETEDDIWCENVAHEAAAYSGNTGGPLWENPPFEGPDLYWYVTDSDLDGMAGDDIFAQTYTEDFRDQRAHFRVINGLDVTSTWDGSFATGGDPGYAGSVMGADLDGDGTSEVVGTASSFEFIDGDPDCVDECRYEEHTLLAVFEPGGHLVSQIEL